MDYRCRIVELPDGSVIVIHPAMRDKTRPVGVADDAWALRCLDLTMAKHPEWQGLRTQDVRSSNLPATRTQRGQWRLRDGKVVAVGP